MTPMRAVLGVVVAAAAAFAVIQNVNSPGPKYLGNFPSIVAKTEAAPAPITHAPAGPTVPDPPHYAADPVVPEHAAAPPPAPAGPGPAGPAAPVGGGGTSGPSAAQPGLGSPLTGSLSPGADLLGALGRVLSSLPPLDLSKYCVIAGRVVALVPCDQIPPVPPIPPAGGPQVP